MADTAAHLVDRVWPEWHIRQWVLSLPVELRIQAAYVRGLAGMLEHVLRGFETTPSASSAAPGRVRGFENRL